jgi:hypothetical protein
MNLPADPRSKLPIFGGIWIALAPLLFLMAAISTVESMTTYYVQLAAFSTVALVGFVAGIGAMFRRVWTGRSMLVLSLVVGAYFCGSALILLLLPFLPWTAAKFDWLIFLLCPAVAATGAPFLLMAWFLSRVLRAIPRFSELA